MKQLKSGFKRTINWSKYLSKVTAQERNQYLYYWIDPNFQAVNRTFVSKFENTTGWKSSKRYYLPNVGIKDYNVGIDGQNFFDQRVKNKLSIYDNIRKIAAGQGVDYTTGCLLDYLYFKNHYLIIAIHLSKQKELDADPKSIQETNFIGNVDQPRNTTVFFIIE